MNEFELIQRLTASLPGNETVVLGPGDDCAALDLGLADQLVLFKTDAVVEGVHFRADDPPEKVGHKALGRCLSDIAAMAGTPTAALVTLGIPKTFSPDYLERVYKGLSELAVRHRVAVVGGETTLLPERMLLSISLLGVVPRERCIRRTGSQPGDALLVTGKLGGSLAGRHLDVEPRLEEARWLAENFPLHAMIDLSDGLAGDLRHLLNPSNLGADLYTPAIPLSAAAKQQARSESSAKPALLAALTDGEDFELLFTVASKQAVPLLDAWKNKFPDLPLSCIGKIKAEPGIILRDKEGARPLNVHGYLHFT